MKRLIGALLIFLMGCATSFQKPLPNADYGSYPEHYQALIRSHMDKVLLDPESARYDFTLPRRAYVNQGLAYGGGVQFLGYVVHFVVNAKNSFGGYAGRKSYMALIREGAIVKAGEEDDFALVREVQ
jgi:hypothetical protein